MAKPKMIAMIATGALKANSATSTAMTAPLA
jgi:hypothetical protein